MTSGYDYRTIQSTRQEIRLLCIDPDCRRTDHAPLRCELKSVSLQDTPIVHFHAVSYCWGTSKKRARVVIDGQDVTIPQVAAVAIRNLGKVSFHPLWIDAVCIDQNNLQEKSRQVGMMKDVFSKAASVLIWLGPAQRSTANAIASIERIHKQCLEATDGLEDLQAHFYGTDGSPGFKYSNAPLPACDWSALQEFYSAPWFGRLWVIQEIGLAKNSAVYVGSLSVDAEKVVLAARWMVHRKYARYYKGLESPGIESASNMYRPAGRPLYNQLRRTHRAGCREAQDRVYGLLGLLREEVAAAIVTNYTRPLVDVYAQVIRLALHEAGDLSFLQLSAWYRSPKPRITRIRRLIQWVSCNCLKPHYSQDGHWPSWVLKLHGETSDESGACRNVLNFKRSSIGANFDLQTRVLDESLVLSLRGLVMDTVSLVGPFFTADLLKDFSQLASAVRWCVRDGCKKGIPEDSTYMKDLALCLTCGSNKVNADATLDPEHTRTFGLFLQECRQPSTAIGRKMSGKLTRLLRLFLPWVPRQDPPVYWHDLWSKALNRRFFLTATGMMGMAPPAIKAGDLICMLFGNETPFVLRPLGHYFELIGDTYVRAGEMPNYGKTGNDAERWFDII